MKVPLYYDDVCLIPSNYSTLESRDHADTSLDFLGFKVKVPVIPANMASVVNIDVCRELSNNGYFYSMHRFGYEYDDRQNGKRGLSVTQKLVQVANDENWPLISISTGVNPESQGDLLWVSNKKYKVDVITVDVALGYHSKVKDTIQFIQKHFPDTRIIAGNVAESKGAKFLANLGVDAIKTGIGQGGPCSTRFQTGFTAPMLWSIMESVKGARKVPIIADGGIQHIGDIAKALVFGAKMVMCGKLFASCIDSAAKFDKDGKKLYYGSASFQSKKHSKNIEGFQLELEAECTILQKMNEIQQALQSSISYAGGKNLEAFKRVEHLLVK